MADATGDAVVISVGKDGDLAFTRKDKGDGYLVSTNFNRANPENAEEGGYPFWRYDTAVDRLQKIKQEDALTVDCCHSILEAVHFESANTNTVYSNVFDLPKRLIYLYHFHQFDEVVTLNLTEELTKGHHVVPIRDLFSPTTVARASAEYQVYQDRAKTEP